MKCWPNHWVHSACACLDVSILGHVRLWLYEQHWSPFNILLLQLVALNIAIWLHKFCSMFSFTVEVIFISFNGCQYHCLKQRVSSIKTTGLAGVACRHGWLSSVLHYIGWIPEDTCARHWSFGEEDELLGMDLIE